MQVVDCGLDAPDEPFVVATVTDEEIAEALS
jgi:hypothetical protein